MDMLAPLRQVKEKASSAAFTAANDIQGQKQSALLNIYKRLPLKIVDGQGAHVKTDMGLTYLDFYSGHAVSSLGHGHPRLLKALHGQLDKLLYYSNLVYLEHQEEAAALLVSLLPKGLNKVFFVNSGAEAIENALKIARLVTQKKAIISFEGGFHGRTLGALAATAIEKYRRTLGLSFEGHHYLPLGELELVEELCRKGDVAAVLLEPIQSLAGVISLSGTFLEGLKNICNRYGVLLIFDELQTGGGRVGRTYSYASQLRVTPDLMTFGKGIGGGIPIAALVASEECAKKIRIGDLGTTFGGGPLATIALKTTIEILLEEELLEHVWLVGEAIKQIFKTQSAQFQVPVEVRGKGLLLGLKTPFPAARLQSELLKAGIITGLCEDPDVLRLMPPLNVTFEELEEFRQGLVKSFESLQETFFA